MNEHPHRYVIGTVAMNGRLLGSCKVCGSPKDWPAVAIADFNNKTAPYGALKVDRERAEFAMADEVVR